MWHLALRRATRGPILDRGATLEKNFMKKRCQQNLVLDNRPFHSSVHPEIKHGHVAVSNSEMIYFLQVQGNQGVRWRRTKVRRTTNSAD